MDDIFHKLKNFLDSIPNGFPTSESGVEIKILKWIFSAEEAELFMKLKMAFETVEQIAARTGVDSNYLNKMLPEMSAKKQLLSVSFAGTTVYRIFPYVFGLYEFQMPRMNKEIVELFEEYSESAFAKEFYTRTPSFMKAIPIGIEVKNDSSIEPYESVISIIEGANSWAVRDCVCKKEKAILTGKKCDKPMEVCMSFSVMPNAFDNDDTSRAITKEEAYAIIKMAEEEGLVHMTSNYKSGLFYICNCCKCCCHPLSKYVSLSKLAVAKSAYVAVVEEDLCASCGTCIDRCQAEAIDLNDTASINKHCLGCGLCVSTCPSNAIRLVAREKEDIPYVPENDNEWMELRAKQRGLSDDYKKLL
jgi:NAD-dependent dihydropyrimidine dehydrogenase PreA subunit